MVKNTIDSLEYTIRSCRNLISKEEDIKYTEGILEKELKDAQNQLIFLKGAKEKYQVAINELYEESIAALRDTLNVALKYIMFDKSYSVDLVLEDNRGAKTLSIFLVNEEENFKVDVKDGVGQGVRTIISFVLKSYYLLNRNSKVLFLDEKYSALSSHYVPRFYEFMERFCQEHDFIVVMISHIENQIEHADKVYYLNDGVVSKGDVNNES